MISQLVVAEGHVLAVREDGTSVVITDLNTADRRNAKRDPLVDLSLTVQTDSAPYTYLISRLEAAQKRDVPVNSFSSRDGPRLILRLIKTRSVRATAKDLTGKPYEAQAPWK